MKIKEIVESYLDSSKQTSLIYKQKYLHCVENFDAYIQHHGTDGANILFKEIIYQTKDELVDFILKGESTYGEMVTSRNKLEEKIKNSSGLTY